LMPSRMSYLAFDISGRGKAGPTDASARSRTT
jgi:hypothetical protein